MQISDGRFDVALFDVGSFDVDPNTYVVIGTPTQQLKRQAQSSLVRVTTDQVFKRLPSGGWIRRP